MRVYSGADYGSVLIMDQAEFAKLQELAFELKDAAAKQEAPNLDPEFVGELALILEGEGRSASL